MRMKNLLHITYMTGVIMFAILSELFAEMQVWYVQLDCKEDGMNASRSSEDDNTLISPPVSCGKDPESPCCNLQHVVDKIQGGDTVYVTQVSADKQSQCNQTLEIQVQVRKSFILKTFMSEKKVDKDSVQGIHGVKLEFSNNCSRLCSLTIGKSYIFCTSLVIKDLDISIKDTQFRESSITAKTHSERQVYRNNMKIQNTEFKNNFPVGVNSAMNFTIVCLVGQWNTVELLRSEFEGDRHSQITGVQVMHANIETLNLIDVQISLMFSALVIRSSNVGIFNITDSIFLGNRDGIDIGQDVRYVMVSRSEMNNTGMWFEDDEALEQCSSALKGSAQTFKIEDSIFAHNQASGRNCTGAALYVRSNVYEMQGLLPSSNEMYEKHNPLIYTIEVMKSVFYANTLKNCSAGLSEGFENGGSGGAIAVYGLQLEIRIMASTFTRNEACKGAGFYVGMSNKWLLENPPNRSAGQVLSARIIIDTCTFTENIAEYGGGLMTEFDKFKLDSCSRIFTLIYNSSFSRNNARNKGAGACLCFMDVSFGSGVAITIKVSDSYFKENVGGAVYKTFTLVTLLSNAQLIIVVNGCTFTSNTAKFGAGIRILLNSCSLDSNSFVMSQVTGSTFTNNTADWGAGIFTRVKSCSVDSNSSIMPQVTGSNFTRNTAMVGAGIYTEVMSCSVDSNSSIMSQVTNSTFTNNKLGLGVGINRKVERCSIHFNSYIMLLVTGSIFSLNTGASGTGIYTHLSRCSVASHSAIISQITESVFLSNAAMFEGAGIYTEAYSCSVNSNSCIMSEVTDSIFLSNIAMDGAGIYTGMRGCSVDSNSSVMSEITGSTFTSNKGSESVAIESVIHGCSVHFNSSIILHAAISNFTLNTAETEGAGINTWVGYCSVDSTSQLTLQTSNSSFLSNKAKRGAGLNVQHYSTDSCISGKVTIIIANCRFLNNSASREEGGALRLKVFHITQVQVKHSVFEKNQALSGSGLYRENVDVQTCNNVPCDQKTYKLIITQIFKCHFIDNIETAILVKSKQRFGTLAITKCSFKNNRCVTSSLAEDIFTDIDLDLTHTNIFKEKQYPRKIGISSQSDAKLQNVTVKNTEFSSERHFSISRFFHFITPANGSSLKYQCPAYYQPILSTDGLTDVGAVMVRASCDACFGGYYTGQSWMIISSETDSEYHCQEKKVYDHYEEFDLNRFCYTHSIGTCNECPHGANCTAGVVALPNYWGHMTAAGRLEFHRCPVGYCCNKALCEGIAQCAAHRQGTLCGRCIKGFTESLLSQECLPDEECDDTWVVPLFISWAFCVTCIITFMGELEQLPHKLLTTCKQYCWNNKENEENLGTSVQIDTFKRNSKTQSIHQEGTAELKPKVLGGTQKGSILCGLLNTEPREHIEQSGNLKYLQIILYYLQDSALLQVDLALDHKGTAIRKIRRMLLNVSQLAVDLLDLGLKLCPIKSWTPVFKAMAKTLTGPLVFTFILMNYLTIRLTCLCFPRKRPSLKKFWYPKLTTAAIFSILLFYQQIANTTFSLLYCIKSDDQSILLIDGTVTCYQPWQILVLIFAINWIVAIIPVLMFLPGLLELRLIGVNDFFLACMLPAPMLLYWGYRIYKKKFCIHTAYSTPWQDEALALLQKTFVKTTYRNMFPFCWLGFMKIRRLALVLIFTFVSNLVGRVSLMCFVLLVFMIIHLITLPYQDKVANVAYTVSLAATLSIGFINIMKATCVEFYLDLDKVKHSLETLDLITDVIFVYCPPVFIILAIIAFVGGKIRASMGKNEDEEEREQAPIVTEDDL